MAVEGLLRPTGTEDESLLPSGWANQRVAIVVGYQQSIRYSSVVYSRTIGICNKVLQH